jgi:hypothetical protein
MMLTEDSHPHPYPHQHVHTQSPSHPKAPTPTCKLGRAAIKKNEKYELPDNFEKKEHMSIGRKMSSIAKKVSLQYKAEKIEICR